MTFKEDVMELLSQFVGVAVRGPVEVYYSEDQKDELAQAAYSLLAEYLGEFRAKEIMTEFLRKHPEIKKWRLTE